ncbi:hypothetical protein LOAG_18356 [Loa loa]|uniref:Uncharacterized protein n=1 Tax=Loa loa TaxID=7209 RepID=A0A1S0UFX3_LOALO|nr:hypothetical protein LOAG_18356 [Loa loa]EJD74316.1 hypothetical protein LOAG_18356 [Loa loa]
MYGSSTACETHLKFLERFHQRCFRTILNIHWTDYVTNVTDPEQVGTTSIELMRLKTQLRWTGTFLGLKFVQDCAL